MLPTWISKYIGLKFGEKGRGPDEFDCWGLVRWIYMNECGLVLPDYVDGYENVADAPGVATSIRGSLNVEWTPQCNPEPMSSVLFNICGKPVHIGIIVYNDYFLHSPEGDFSRCERLSDRKWNRRIEGFYRPTALSGVGQAASA